MEHGMPNKKKMHATIAAIRELHVKACTSNRKEHRKKSVSLQQQHIIIRWAASTEQNATKKKGKKIAKLKIQKAHVVLTSNERSLFYSFLSYTHEGRSTAYSTLIAEYTQNKDILSCVPRLALQRYNKPAKQHKPFKHYI